MDDHLAWLMLYAKDNMQHVFRTSIRIALIALIALHPKMVSSVSADWFPKATKALRILTDLLLHLRWDAAASHQGLALQTLHVRLAAGQSALTTAAFQAGLCAGVGRLAEVVLS